MTEPKVIEYESEDWVIEPSNISCIHCINTINIANVDRNKCDTTEKAIIVNKTGLTGDIVFHPGFNCAISAKNNIITIDSVKGGGACGEEDYCGASKVPMTEEEAQKIANGEFLDNCLLCNETIKAINGVNGKVINIIGGPGIRVETNGNTIKLKLETKQLKNGCEVE